MAQQKYSYQELAEMYVIKKPTLIYVKDRDTFYTQDTDLYYYKPLELDMVRSEIAIEVDTILDGHVSKSYVDNVFMWVKIKMQNSGRQLPTININKILFTDGHTLDLSTLTVEPYNQTDRIFFLINSRSPEPDEPCEMFQSFLSQVLVIEESLEPDTELIALAQEMFGYYLLTKIEPPTAFFLVGNGANGKSTLLFILEQLMGGEDFIMENSIQMLTTDKWAKEELRYNRLNSCGEEQSKYLQADSFKKMLEGGMVSTDIKFQNRIKFRSYTKHIFATNHMPNFGTIDYGLKRRFKIMPFHRQFKPHEIDTTLKTENFTDSKFAPELAGIVAWAIEGAKKLIANGYKFSQALQEKQQMETYEEEVSSVINFMRSNFELFPTDEVAESFSSHRLYEIYVGWCKDTGHKSVSDNNFRKELRNNLNLKTKTVRDKMAQQETIRGYKLKILPTSHLAGVELTNTNFESLLNLEHSIPNM
jgi:P4 family phage/plasmid primase-like protien